MRTILAILAAAILAAPAFAETEALVTDTNNNVISGRAGALLLSNPIAVGDTELNAQGLSWAGDPRIDFEQVALVDSNNIAVLSWGGESLVFGRAIDFGTNAAATRTNLGLGGTNTPTFAGLTLTTLTNSTPQVVLADTNGTFTTGSVPSGGAPEGAVLTAIGGGSSFVQREWVAIKPADTSKTNDATASVSLPNDPDLTIAINAGLYRMDGLLSFAAPISGGFKSALSLPAQTPYSLNVVTLGGGGVATLAAGSTNTNVVILLNQFSGTTPAEGSILTFAAIFKAETNGNVAIRWAQNSATTNSATLQSNSFIRVQRISP
jgi:hypothetical protein